MAFKVLFISHAPDANVQEHRCIIETPKYYKLFVVVVKDQKQAVEVCRYPCHSPLPRVYP